MLMQICCHDSPLSLFVWICCQFVKFLSFHQCIVMDELTDISGIITDELPVDNNLGIDKFWVATKSCGEKTPLHRRKQAIQVDGDGLQCAEVHK